MVRQHHDLKPIRQGEAFGAELLCLGGIGAQRSDDQIGDACSEYAKPSASKPLSRNAGEGGAQRKALGG